MDAKKVDPSHVAVPWNLSDLRKAWNQAKAEVAPWWEDNSKECYSSGLADLVTALGNWKKSKDGTGSTGQLNAAGECHRGAVEEVTVAFRRASAFS